MAFVPVPNCAEVEIRQQCDNQLIENTLYFEHATPPTATELQALADSIEAWWGDSILPLLSNTLTYRETYVTDLSEATGPTATQAGFAPAAGGSPDNHAPNNVSLCVSFRTAGRGRSSRGRNYVAGIPSTGVNGDLISQTFTDSVVAAYNNLNVLGNLPSGWTWVVVSRFSGGAARATGVAFPVTRALAVDRIVDSQRRRLPGRGN
jgi:hypothetical protein